MSLLDNMPHTATARRGVRTRGTLGHRNSSTTLWEGRSCWLQGASASAIREFGRRGQVLTHTVFFASDPGLTEADTLEIDSTTYEVQAAADPDCSAGMGLLYCAHVRRTTTGSTDT